VANSAEWKVVPLAASIDQRDASTLSTDGLMVNGYLEKDAAGAVWTRRRAGLTDSNQLSHGTGTAIITAFGTVVGFSTGTTDTIYVNGALRYTYGNSTGVSWFNQTTVVANQNTYASNGTEGAVRTGPGFFSKITDANYPAQTLNGSAFLNGYLYVLDQFGSVWGTVNQNDFSTWSATNVINAWGTVGGPIAIRRYLNEILVFKTFTTEVFYDSGNSVGSPLLPVQQINIKWGCANAQTIVNIDDDIFWVGASESGLNAVIRMNQFAPQPISTPQINRFLNVRQPTSSPFPYGVKAAFSCSMGGDKFYCLSYVQNQNSVLSTIVFAYNITTGEWSTFAPNTISPTIPYYPVASSDDPTVDFQQILMSNGKVYLLDDSVTVDSSVQDSATKAISMRLRTDNFEAGTSLGKMVSGLRIKADQKGASALRIRWSDDDYQTWSAWRTIDLSKKVPMLPGLQGTFAKRAYELEYAGLDKIRFSRLELLIALCDI
jgi:hypothetical protein